MTILQHLAAVLAEAAAWRAGGVLDRAEDAEAETEAWRRAAEYERAARAWEESPEGRAAMARWGE